MVQNKALIYKSIPVGLPKVGKDLVVESTDVNLDTAPKGGIITQNLYASFDPSQRARMRDASIKSYNLEMEVGKPLESVATLARILKSDHEALQEGDIVQIWYGCTEEYSILEAQNIFVATECGLRHYTEMDQRGRKVIEKTTVPDGVPASAFLGVLGMSGMTAYGSLHEVGKPKKGETIWVSAAAGAVGQVVGQIAVREGLNVIGSVGDDRKLDYITKELGFTSGFNYKKEKPEDALKRLAPNGLDIFFDNVGGEQLDAALNMLNVRGRIVACGAISGYSNAGEPYGVKNTYLIISKRLNYQGILVVDDNILRHEQDRNKDIVKWLQEGSFKSIEHVTEGIDKAAEGFLGMLNGENLGKAILKISNE